MAIIKPLTEEEVPEQAQDLFDYDVQWQEPVPNKSGRPKNRTMIQATCRICFEKHAVPVNDVRNWIRGVRPRSPGTHRKCLYPGKYTNPDGRSFIWAPDHPNARGKRYVPENIYVMSNHLGRKIDTERESVHHINGDVSDNRLENLQLRKAFHGKGQKWKCGDCGSHNILPFELDE